MGMVNEASITLEKLLKSQNRTRCHNVHLQTPGISRHIFMMEAEIRKQCPIVYLEYMG